MGAAQRFELSVFNLSLKTLANMGSFTLTVAFVANDVECLMRMQSALASKPKRLRILMTVFRVVPGERPVIQAREKSVGKDISMT
jgi:hypothetical protein